MITITQALSIPDSEIIFIASRSSGPGGQHVNKTSSRVTLIFNLQESASLSNYQKRTLLSKIGNKVNSKGELQISCEEHRSQFRNKEEALERFKNILADGLKPIKQRRKTKVPNSTKRKRMDNKNKRATTKKQRSKPDY
ncbi:alternative ribosome rescue aminoacyl-tRNA hydrolase ArfB [Maridesulfovibrio ferrireducens]|uniref:alternative ribosome rescue aminoacyl-tRNA hydrolase ArfB n=1 Tax=Maridesulfovibrio ferrireducens TaxID=246191 RepID=UPI001A27ABBD|nr:alternative ribosome rescue aminoacyl-tRNA hydrolase ArfB [Maridesulfovibrio ferrireducens]MBI9111275.1 aminoacyl-tRNA hydrolase [Maridesulfovibrio ferrireducens]